MLFIYHENKVARDIFSANCKLKNKTKQKTKIKTNKQTNKNKTKQKHNGRKIIVCLIGNL